MSELTAGGSIPWKLPKTLERRPEREAEDEGTRVRARRSCSRSRRTARRGRHGVRAADAARRRASCWPSCSTTTAARRSRNTGRTSNGARSRSTSSWTTRWRLPISRPRTHLRSPGAARSSTRCAFRRRSSSSRQIRRRRSRIRFVSVRPAPSRWLDAQHGHLGLKRGPRRMDDPLPSAIIAGPPLDTRTQRAALARVGDAWLRRGCRHVSRPIVRHPRAASPLDPRSRGGRSGCQTAQSRRAAGAGRAAGRQLSLHPGATRFRQDLDRRAIDRVAASRRAAAFGVAANSHKAINNLLEGGGACRRGRTRCADAA